MFRVERGVVRERFVGDAASALEALCRGTDAHARVVRRVHDLSVATVHLELQERARPRVDSDIALDVLQLVVVLLAQRPFLLVLQVQILHPALFCDRHGFGFGDGLTQRLHLLFLLLELRLEGCAGFGRFDGILALSIRFLAARGELRVRAFQLLLQLPRSCSARVSLFPPARDLHLQSTDLLF